jgi:hypothetical protein
MRPFPLFLLLLSSLFMPATTEAKSPWKGLMFTPVATTNNSHNAFIKNFEELAKVLKNKGINTIVFDMNYKAFHFTCDPRLNKFSYPPQRGFTTSETRQMAKIARDNGMSVIVALQVLTHSAGHVFSETHPEYMLPVSTWKQGTLYEKKLDYVHYEGKTYKAICSHTSNTDNVPPTTIYWEETASSPTRNPFAADGESLIFKMIDELIQAFTVNGIAPEGFHIGSDELRHWYKQPELATGQSSAQIFAMAISNAFNHIRAKNPAMEVIMWGDMLDEHWNGAPKSTRNIYGKNTATAIDLIPKDIIIADWRYEANKRYGYDPTREEFPSVGKFLNKGFRVWPTSWAEVKGTTDLVWTGNKEQAKTNRIVGHLYSTWLDWIIPEFAPILTDPAWQVPDSTVANLEESNKPKFKAYYRGIADSINSTVHLVGVKKCRGTDFSCGAYPACEDAIGKSGYRGDEFHACYCDNNIIKYKVIPFPDDYVAYWQFEGDANDATGKNNGIMNNGVSLIKDAEKGFVAKFSGVSAAVRVPNNKSLQMGTGSLSISAWFKVSPSENFATLLSKGLTNFCLLLHQDGRILLKTNDNDCYRYSAEGVSYRDNHWHHVVAIFDELSNDITIYVDGKLSNQTRQQSVCCDNNKSNNKDLYIGNHGGVSQYQLNGYIDDIMVFNRSLSWYEVLSIYKRKINISSPK